MSFFDTAAEAFNASRGAAGNPLALLASAGVVAFNAADQSRANTEAARIAAEAERAKAAAIAQANDAAQARLDILARNAAPAQSFLRGQVASNPNVLTPLQKQQLEEVQRETTRGLNASGLRGSGRAQVAAFRDVVGGTRNRFIESNIRRQDRAASGLSGQFGNAVTRQANIDINTGRAAGDSALAAGTVDANATTANAGLRGQALNDIASFISQDAKNRRRASRLDGQVASQTGRNEKERV